MSPVDVEALALQMRNANKLGAQPLENWSKVVAEVLTPDGWDIYTFRLDGTALRKLTHYPGLDIEPRLNPQGTEVVFTSDRDGNYEIYKMPLDGSAPPQRLTHSDGVDRWPVWSGNGRRIAFSSTRNGRYEVFIMNADGSNPYRIEHDPYANAVMPVWSPNNNISSLHFIKYRSTGGGSIWTTGHNLLHFYKVMDEMPRTENLRAAGKGAIYFDADVDNDGETELLLQMLRCCDGPLLLYDAHQENLNLLAGHWTPTADPARPYGSILYSRIGHHFEGDQRIIHEFNLEIGTLNDKRSLIERKPLAPLSMVGGWFPDDKEGPRVHLYPLPERIQALESHLYLDYEIEEEPGGSGIVSVSVNGQTVDVTEHPDRLPYALAGVPHLRPIKIQIQGRDQAGNLGPPSQAITTTLFRYFTGARAVDVMGRPILGATIARATFTPRADSTDERGLLFGLEDSESTWVEFVHSAYLRSRRTDLPVVRDSSDLEPGTVVLYPENELITTHLPDKRYWRLQPSASYVQGNGVFVLLGYTGDDQSNSPSEAYAEIEIEVPETMHRPVAHISVDGKLNHDRFSFYVNDGVSSTFLLKMSPTGVETHPSLLYSDPPRYTFDLSSWKGKHLTVRVHIEAEGTQLKEHVNLYGISIGTWNTPVIASAQEMGEAERAADGTSTLVITGENLFSTSRALLNGEELTGVRLIGDNKLSAQLPAGLAPGQYEIRIINWDDATAVGVASIGRQTHLPVISP